MLCGSHIEIWNLTNQMKKQNKNTRSIGEKLKNKSLMFFVSFVHVIFKISNFNMWTAKLLAQASCPKIPLQSFHRKSMPSLRSCLHIGARENLNASSK